MFHVPDVENLEILAMPLRATNATDGVEHTVDDQTREVCPRFIELRAVIPNVALDAVDLAFLRFGQIIFGILVSKVLHEHAAYIEDVVFERSQGAVASMIRGLGQLYQAASAELWQLSVDSDRYV